MKKVVLLLCLLSCMVKAQQLVIQEKVKFLALGDSYTIGQSVAAPDCWPAQLIEALRKKGLLCFDPKIIATTGWRTDNLQRAINNANLANEYNLVSLLIGVNNFYQGQSVENYKPQFEALLTNAITLAGGDKSHVFVVSIPDYGYTPFGKSNQATISKTTDDFNNAAQVIANQAGVLFFNITDISRHGLSDPALVANDGLHPSGKMYAEWVARIIAGATISEGSGNNENPDVPNPVTGATGEVLGMNIYPNPFTEKLILDNLPQEQITLRIIDMYGAEVSYYSLPGNDTSMMVDTASIQRGLYYYQVQNSNHIFKEGRLLKLR